MHQVYRPNSRKAKAFKEISAAVTTALVKAHPYKEPAFDIYPLKSAPRGGIGRYGELPRAVSLVTLARRLKKKLGASGVQIVGRPAQKVGRAVIVVGAAGSLPFSLPLSGGDVVITGEIRHHDALTMKRLGCGAIALGHWTSERPVLQSVAKRLAEASTGLRAFVSGADKEPFQPA
jgi:putative NIF3 family GTP cyclohydrolase 1 type 2